MGLKKILSISLPVTIILLVIAFISKWDSTTGGILLGLVLIQGIFWKFAKWRN